MSIATANALSRDLFLYRGLDGEAIDDLAAQFRAGSPFPFIQIKNFLNSSNHAAPESLPDTEWPGWRRYYDKIDFRKMICSDIDRIPPELGALIHDLNSPAFLRFLE